jgi:putative flippase GtrA
MATFIKAQAASLTATIVDFTVTVLLKEVFHCWYLLASILGTVSGGVVNFMMNRSWVFRARDKKIHYQAIKYILVWIRQPGIGFRRCFPLNELWGSQLCDIEDQRIAVRGFFL